MGKIRLSVCIPTYNFGEFIGETLDSITAQATDEVEIIIVDGASIDNTELIVKRVKRQFARLIYHRRERNIGLDADLAMAVELAQGDYCWLMSSDDVLKPGAVDRILREIKFGHAVYLCNRTECDRNLQPVKDGAWFRRVFRDHVFDLSTNSEMLRYLNASQSLGALFSYISSIIVNRKKWNEIENDEAFTGSNYAHVFRIFSMIKNGGDLKYIKARLVYCRRGNDSFSNKGAAARTLLDLNAYEMLAEKLFDNTDLRIAFKSVMRRQYVWFLLAGVRNDVGDIEVWNELERKLHAFDYSRRTLLSASILGSSRVIIKTARYLKKIERKIRIVIRKLADKDAPASQVDATRSWDRNPRAGGYV